MSIRLVVALEDSEDEMTFTASRVIELKDSSEAEVALEAAYTAGLQYAHGDPDSRFKLPKKVWNDIRTEFGVPTGGTRHCKLEGCNGIRLGVRWPDGKLTFPCTKGMSTSNPDEWQIER